MEAFAMIQSGLISAQTLKKTLIENHGVDIDSDPTFAADFNNILNVFSLLSYDLGHDDLPESSRRNNPPRALLKSGGKDEITGIVHTPTLITNDGSWNKYGSKFIRNSPYKRGYYRCRYGDCKAKRHVQQIKKNQNRPLVYETTYLNRHTCQAANNDIDGSTRMIQFDSQVLPSVSDWDLPPLLSADHPVPVTVPVPVPVPGRNDDVHVSWLNPTIPVNSMKAEDESCLNPSSIPVNEMKGEDDDECLLKFDEPVVWSPSYPDMDTCFEDDFELTF